jgi:cobalt-zinc-cadmium resistance protein CzcA
MDRKVVDFSLRYRFLVLLGVIAIIGFGIYEYRQLPVDAFPDISPIMVPVFTEAHGMAPEEVERLITFPIESKMNGLPGIKMIKSTSAAGMSVIYVYFEDNVDMYFARQIVAERLNQAMADLPELHDPPKLGPISTGLGQIFIYYLSIDPGTDTEGKEPNTYLREINDWIVKYQLQTVPGVTDILSIGGHVLQYQIKINPHSLNKYDISLEDIVESVRKNNRNAGGQFMLMGNEEHTVRGIGLLQNLDDIRNIQVKAVNGVPIRISDVAEVDYGREIRRGVVSLDGEQEVVSGMVLQLYGQNTSKVIKRLYEKIPEVQASLPPGVHIVPYYEQAELVKNATWTVKRALLEGAVLSIIVLIIFLGNFRSAFIVALSLPICALVAIICMHLTGMSANLMSLGGIAIAIGMLADGSIVMVENIFRHLNTDQGTNRRSKTTIILDAAKEVSRPIAFAITIVVIVFIPIYALGGIEGIMFKPMAFTLSFALLGSLIAALVVSPVLCTYLLKTGKHKEFFFIHWLRKLYYPLLATALRFRSVVVGMLVILLIASLCTVPYLGTEFIPTLEEGSILIGVGMAPSVSLEKATETIQALECKIIKYDEVEEVVSRIGRPEAGSHPHPVNYAEIHITLKPLKEWSRFNNKQELVEALNTELSQQLGVTLNFSQPIQNAFDELLSGVKAQVAIKVCGEDLDILRRKAGEVMHAVEDVPGFVDLSVEQSYGQPQVQVIADRDACARLGVNVSEILELVELAIGGEVIDSLYLNTRRFGIHVRYQEPYRNDPKAIENLLVHTEGGALIPLKEVAEVKQVVGPIQVNRENNQRRWTVQGNIRGTDLGSVIAEVKKRIKEKVVLPPGYYVEYGGQFESQQRAMTRLSIIVPIVIITVFLMLFFTFGSLRSAILIVLTLPMALIGGIFGLFFSGSYLSVPAAVGFIALFGIAVQDGIVLVSCINERVHEGIAVKDAVIAGCMHRLRPVLMTSFTTVLGLTPLLLATGIGSEIQRPLAIVVTCGLSSATILTLFVIPALYPWFAALKTQTSSRPDRMGP